MSFILEFSHGSCLVMWFICPLVFPLLGTFDLKQRCAEWSPYDIKYRESDKKAVGSYAFESFSRYFDVIRWSFCAALLQVECTYWFFVSCVMFSLVVLVMCLFSHWLVLVMWPSLFDINSPHVALVLCLLLSCKGCFVCSLSRLAIATPGLLYVFV